MNLFAGISLIISLFFVGVLGFWALSKIREVNERGTD